MTDWIEIEYFSSITKEETRKVFVPVDRVKLIGELPDKSCRFSVDWLSSPEEWKTPVEDYETLKVRLSDDSWSCAKEDFATKKARLQGTEVPSTLDHIEIADEVQRCTIQSPLFYLGKDWLRIVLPKEDNETTEEKIKRAMDCEQGLYTVRWKSGGSSIASIGVQSNGERWIAPANWIKPATLDRKIAQMIESLEKIPVENEEE